VGTAMSRSIAELAPGAAIHVNPLDLAQLGVEAGDDVTLTSASATAVLPVVTNAAVPRGIAWSPFNQHGGAATDLVDSTADVTDVRIERVG
ncbi:MAG: molybdopterin dinucleotide binding domain-containing protein, partial [Actinomycetota bacterium]